MIAADIDWLNVSTKSGVNEINIFDSFISFPEAGQNSLRFECMANLYSKALAVHSNGESILLKGSENDLRLFNTCISELTLNERIVGFEFSEST